MRREGIELSGTFVATVNGDLRVGALEETITVTGETPIVDVQSARTQQTISKDILTAIPSSRNAGGIQALVPGMAQNIDSGNIAGTLTGAPAPFTAAGRAIRGSTRMATTWAGPAAPAAAGTCRRSPRRRKW